MLQHARGAAHERAASAWSSFTVSRRQGQHDILYLFLLHHPFPGPGQLFCRGRQVPPRWRLFRPRKNIYGARWTGGCKVRRSSVAPLRERASPPPRFFSASSRRYFVARFFATHSYASCSASLRLLSFALALLSPLRSFPLAVAHPRSAPFPAVSGLRPPLAAPPPSCLSWALGTSQQRVPRRRRRRRREAPCLARL